MAKTIVQVKEELVVIEEQLEQIRARFRKEFGEELTFYCHPSATLPVEVTVAISKD